MRRRIYVAVFVSAWFTLRAYMCLRNVELLSSPTTYDEPSAFDQTCALWFTYMYVLPYNQGTSVKTICLLPYCVGIVDVFPGLIKMRRRMRQLGNEAL